MVPTTLKRIKNSGVIRKLLNNTHENIGLTFLLPSDRSIINCLHGGQTYSNIIESARNSKILRKNVVKF